MSVQKDFEDDRSMPAFERRMTLEQSIDEIKLAEIHDPAYYRWYFRFIMHPQSKFCILTFWTIVLFIGLAFSYILLDHTTLTLYAPRGSDGWTARHKLHNHFPKLVKSNYALIYFHCPKRTCGKNGENATILDDNITQWSNMSQYIRDEANKWGRNHDSFVYNISDYWTGIDTCEEYGDEESEIAKCKASKKETYVSSDDLAGLMLIQHKKDVSDQKRIDFLHKMRHTLEDSEKLIGKLLTADLTGTFSLWRDMQVSSNETIDSHLYVLPLILLVFGYVISSWRLVFIPVMAFTVGINAAFVTMIPVALWMFDLSTTTPSIMTTLSLALCIDYNLFILVRFKEEIGEERETMRYSEVVEALRRALRWSGEVVMVSGFILWLALMGYIFCDLGFLQSFGVGLAITVAFAIAINMTATPATILLFPAFFTQFGCNCRNTKIIYDDADEEEIAALTANAEPDDDDKYGATEMSKTADGAGKPIQSTVADKEKVGDGSEEWEDPDAPLPQLERQMSWQGPTGDPFDPFPLNEEDHASVFNQCWYKCGTWTTLFPISLFIILIVYCLIVPIGVWTFSINIVYAQSINTPRDSTHWHTLKLLRQDFPAGLFEPYYVLIKRKGQTNTVWNFTYINDTANIMRRVTVNLNNSDASINSISGISVYEGDYVDTEDKYANYDASDLYHEEVDDYVSENEFYSYFLVISDKYPEGYSLKYMVRRLRNNFKHKCHHTGSGLRYHCYLYNGAIDTVDSVSNLYETFPIILAVTMVVIFCLAGLIWKNKFLPIRLFLTIAMPFMLIFGMCYLIYQAGMFDWWNSARFHSTHGLAWIIPLMTVTVLFGLALDYDIFLWSRIDEYVKYGVPMRAAIVRGVCKTGNIITAAGCIMATAFCGLFFSTITSINQAAFILVFSVLVDTFIIRTSLVPSILAIGKDMEWHPWWKEQWLELKRRLRSNDRGWFMEADDDEPFIADDDRL